MRDERFFDRPRILAGETLQPPYPPYPYTFLFPMCSATLVEEIIICDANVVHPAGVIERPIDGGTSRGLRLRAFGPPAGPSENLVSPMIMKREPGMGRIQ